MKKLILILSFLLFVGCATSPKRIPEVMIIMGVDFTEYSQKGFLFTPDSYTGDYLSKGLITLTFYPEANKITTHRQIKNNVGEYEKRTEVRWVVDNINSNTLLDSVYSKCLNMGADAFTKLKILDAETIQHGVGTTSPIAINGITIKGYAIERLGAFK